MSQDPRPDDMAIRAAAREFRAALDAIDRTHWQHIHIGNFPRGACGHCAELLARHLHKRFGITPDYVSGNLEGEDGRFECGHAWLEWNGLLIDISGDQFGWAPVIVTRTPGPDYTGSRLNTRHCWALDPDWWGRQCGAVWHAAQSYLAGTAVR